MISVLYEDQDVIVVQKPPGLESQSSRGFTPDMVSEIRGYLHRSQDIHKITTTKSASLPPYVGVIHRLDKPVGGVMVYAKNQKSAASLSAALQAGKMEKSYMAVICGKLVDKQGEYVDYLRQDKKNNRSEIVDKSVKDGRKSALRYREIEVIHNPENEEEWISLIDIELLTGRHHQIRVQLAGHGTPIYGDGRYGDNLSTAGGKGLGCNGGGICGSEKLAQSAGTGRRPPLALCASRLSFPHPATGRLMCFKVTPSRGAFDWFSQGSSPLHSKFT